MTFACCNENRRAAVLGNPSLNGIDYLEVLDHAAKSIAGPPPSPRQRTLLIHLLNAAPTDLTPKNVLITGGESIMEIVAQWIAPATPAPPQATAGEAAYFAGLDDALNVLVVRTSAWGDFSRYSFRLVNDASAAAEDTFDTTEVLDGFDPQLAEVDFSFKVECGPEFDCGPTPDDCQPDLPTPPPINYLAKDYGAFRQVMLDRLNQLLPNWNAATEADLGVMMAELVAYAGDQLSYRQDAVATEAYLATARSRISLRRHARLVDYFVHDGCNARVWMHLEVSAPAFIDSGVTRFYTTAPNMPASLEVGQDSEEAALAAGVIAFQPMQDAHLFPHHNTLHFYTWGDTNCCLPAGATSATLRHQLNDLQVGDVLIFQEVMGPQTGFAADADLRHRCAVRLTAVTTQNAKGDPLVDPLFDKHGDPITSAAQTPMPITEIQWSAEDALPFPVCISSTYVDGGKQISLKDVSVALGNIVLADHGLTMPQQSLGTVPEPSLFYPASGDRCDPSALTPFPVRFRPMLPDSPVTQAVALPDAGSPVTSNAVALKSNGLVSLNDSQGFVALMVGVNQPKQWPQYFSVLASPHVGDATKFDLAVVLTLPDGPIGVTVPIILENFSGLNLNSADPDFVTTRLADSRFVRVPAAFTLPTTVPATFGLAPAALHNDASPTSIDDGGGTEFLEVEPTQPLGWPPLFGVLIQGDLNTPGSFNFLLVYAPQSGGIGVTLPVVAARVNAVTPEDATTQLGVLSDLLQIKTFEDQPNASLSASALMQFDANTAVPAITLTSTPEAATKMWTAAPDLLAAGPDDTEFVVEVDTDGAAYLRFGDGTNGKVADSGSTFNAIYRIGNGTAGNVGAQSVIHYAAGPLADAAITSCTNPLPATGGVDPETNAQIQRRAPEAFLTQERAITMPDYVAAAEVNPRIEDAAATLRWTGSWYTVFIAAEPQNNAPLDKALRRSVTKTVNSYRLAGQDVFIEPPQYVSLQIKLTVCVTPGFFQRDVQKALMQALGSGTLADGTPAFFAAQNFELGETVYLSPIYAAARKVPGVDSITATVFQPQGLDTSVYLQQGYIPMGAFQVARMANDRSLPGNGQLTLVMQGGR